MHLPPGSDTYYTDQSSDLLDWHRLDTRKQALDPVNIEWGVGRGARNTFFRLRRLEALPTIKGRVLTVRITQTIGSGSYRASFSSTGSSYLIVPLTFIGASTGT